MRSYALKILILLIAALLLNADGFSQRRSPASGTRSKTVRSPDIGKTAVVLDETLSVLRKTPSLFSDPVQRMRRGRNVRILDVEESDGVVFYKVTAPPANFGWVQADAVFGHFRKADEERLARLVQASTGFEQIELAHQFFELYPKSVFLPSLLLLFGDLLEETAIRLSRDATNRLSRKEMAASAAPLHSYYLNFVSLDRYRRLGVKFLFNTSTRQFHYDGAAWKEIITKHPSSSEVSEAARRLETLNLKLERAAGN